MKPSSIAATGVLSLGLLLPFGAGTFSDRAIAAVRSAAGEAPLKHVTLVRNGGPEVLETRASTVDDVLTERGIVRSPEDAVSADPAAPVEEGSVIEYRAAVPVTLIVDNVTRQIRTPAQTVRELLAAQHVDLAAHDALSPAPGAAIGNDAVVRVVHVTSWIEHVRRAIPPPVRKAFDFHLAAGKTRVVDPGVPGMKETLVAYSQPDRGVAPRRSYLASRILREPRARVIAQGVGEYTAFANIATRGMEGTVKLASAALSMIATAYTANCAGCSGITAIGRSAGHGIVAVDPHFIPLGTHLFIPGYGHALAGDTGGAIRGNRIDLGFDSHGDAMSFGRRAITVYVLK